MEGGIELIEAEGSGGVCVGGSQTVGRVDGAHDLRVGLDSFLLNVAHEPASGEERSEEWEWEGSGANRLCMYVREGERNAGQVSGDLGQDGEDGRRLTDDRREGRGSR